MLQMTNLESCGVLEFPNTLESKLNIETMSPSCDTLIPSEWEFGRKWLYLKRENLIVMIIVCVKESPFQEVNLPNVTCWYFNT